MEWMDDSQSAVQIRSAKSKDLLRSSCVIIGVRPFDWAVYTVFIYVPTHACEDLEDRRQNDKMGRRRYPKVIQVTRV